ncbi:MAG: 2,3,4,5-tetrahydropyridine-2,6-dicarboxylate N-succinyltransferase [Propionibacteriaceae bacterium]|jgi:2,3,4,5-tetrahydropyridine-2-carboxylate N-succinyltransferase|nr:2,3,4,5-tetrahydropyridine-2,6-dicarboxylate N-succinyltransferase [Propionibacteriaceae bacterium]
MSRTAAAWGWATVHPSGVLDARFPDPRLGSDPGPTPAQSTLDLPGLDAAARQALLQQAELIDRLRQVERRPVKLVIDLDQPPRDAPDVYLRLHLLSRRLCPPNGLNLDGVFERLNTVAWTSAGPCAPDGFDQTRLALEAVLGQLTVLGLDKFPRLLDYVVPADVRIADAARVRLGAHLAAGTTVMPAGFVNFNAGTLGPAMVEGRISAGVSVGAGSDIGGGASIMGTLSGGGRERVSLGRRCLLGAQAGLGIALGDDCVVEAGLYLTAGVKLTLPDDRTVKARELSGQSGWLFYRDSLSGRVMARPRQQQFALNAALHAN